MKGENTFFWFFFGGGEGEGNTQSNRVVRNKAHLVGGDPPAVVFGLTRSPGVEGVLLAHGHPQPGLGGLHGHGHGEVGRGGGISSE